MKTSSDARYTITKEWTGHEKPHWVVRFCDEWVGSHESKSETVKIAEKYEAARWN